MDRHEDEVQDQLEHESHQGLRPVSFDFPSHVEQDQGDPSADLTEGEEEERGVEEVGLLFDAIRDQHGEERESCQNQEREGPVNLLVAGVVLSPVDVARNASQAEGGTSLASATRSLAVTASWLRLVSTIVKGIGSSWTRLEALSIVQEPVFSGLVVAAVALGRLTQVAGLAREDAEEVDLQVAL